MAKKTINVYDTNNENDIHRLKTYLKVIKGYLEGAYNVCNDVENNLDRFPEWNESVVIYITAALNLINILENRYENK